MRTRDSARCFNPPRWSTSEATHYFTYHKHFFEVSIHIAGEPAMQLAKLIMALNRRHVSILTAGKPAMQSV